MAQVQIDDQVREVLQMCREAPGLVVRGAYLSAARKFCNKTRWLVKAAAVTTVASTPVYTITPPDAFTEVIGIQAMSLTENATRINVLSEGFSGEWDPNPGSENMPDTYQYVPEGQVAFFPTPGDIWTVNATVVLQPRRDAVSIDSTLLVSWDHALQAGALAYLLALPRSPWTDKKEALVQDAIFRNCCNQAHMSAQRGYNAGARTTDRPGSNTGAVRTRILPI